MDKETLVDLLKEVDNFACSALTAYIHKTSLFDDGRGRFPRSKNFLDAVSEIQQKVRVAIKELETKEGPK